MAIDKISAIANVAKSGGIHSEVGSFKAVLDQKRASFKSAPDNLQTALSTNTSGIQIKSVVNDMVNNHEMATKSIKTFMTRTNYSPENLLAIQYKTGMLFLREQMFCKTAELSANTFKNFTQMQI